MNYILDENSRTGSFLTRQLRDVQNRNNAISQLYNFSYFLFFWLNIKHVLFATKGLKAQVPS